MPPQQALVDEKKAAVRAGEASIEKGKGKDLLSMVGEFRERAWSWENTTCMLISRFLGFRLILVRANMDPDLKENQRMSDAEG
jgi:hypothetical protein